MFPRHILHHTAVQALDREVGMVRDLVESVYLEQGSGEEAALAHGGYVSWLDRRIGQRNVMHSLRMRTPLVGRTGVRIGAPVITAIYRVDLRK